MHRHGEDGANVSLLSFNSKRAILTSAAILVALIAVSDWLVTEPIPLGFLYLLPMYLFGRVLGLWPIAAIAAVCAGLAEAYDGFPFTLYTGAPRLILYFAAFVTTGLFVREINRSRRQTLVHIREIEEQRDALREAGQQLKALIESNPAAIVTTDSSGRILMANQAAHALFGVLAPLLLDSPIQRYLPSLANLIPGESVQPKFRAVMQTRGFREDGDVFLADVCFSTYPTSSGVRLTAMVLDISEDLRQHEESSLHQLMTGSRIAAGAMSHEIRNICGAIGVIHQNLNRSGLVAGNKDFESLGGLLHMLENVAAIELRTTTASSEEVDLLSVLNDVSIVVSPSLREAGIESTWSFEEDLPLVWANRSQLMQIFLNLTNNSIRALSGAGRRVLRVSARRKERSVQVEFCDTGGGVGDVENLFRPFQHGAVATGLGLYLSRAFARSFGGDLRYEAVPGEACFVVELMPVNIAKAS